MCAPSTSASVMMMSARSAAARGRSARRCRSPAPGSGPGAPGSGAACRRVALATFRILPRSGRIAWVSRLRACLAEPPALIALDQEDLGAVGGFAEQSASLPGSRSLRVAVLRGDSLSCLRRSRSSARSIDDARAGCRRWPGRRSASGRNGRAARSRPALRLGGGQPLLGLALELRLRDEDARAGRPCRRSRRRR